MIQLKNVTKKYGNFVALDNVSFEINEGEIIGLVGPNGAGKSTTMNIITGFIEQTSGEVLVDGYDMLKKPKKAKKKIGYMPEGVPLYTDLTVKEFVTYMAELKGVKKQNRAERVSTVIEETGLKEVENKLTRNLSRGYKQRASMAGALVGDPKILILDEPTVGLDPKQITEIRALIKGFGKKHTVILSSHILSEVSQICNKVIIINKGKIVAIDTPKKLENKVSGANGINLIVEDENDKLKTIKSKIKEIKSIKLIKENEDKTKEYVITCTKDVDIRKKVFEACAKAGVTIFELKKTDATLEDAFMKLIEEPVSNSTADTKTEKVAPKTESKKPAAKKAKASKSAESKAKPVANSKAKPAAKKATASKPSVSKAKPATNSKTKSAANSKAKPAAKKGGTRRASNNKKGV